MSSRFISSSTVMLSILLEVLSDVLLLGRLWLVWRLHVVGLLVDVGKEASHLHDLRLVCQVRGDLREEQLQFLACVEATDGAHFAYVLGQLLLLKIVASGDALPGDGQHRVARLEARAVSGHTKAQVLEVSDHRGYVLYSEEGRVAHFPGKLLAFALG